MTERPINPVLKQVLELGPPIAFFILYIWIKDETYTIGGTDYSGFIVAAGAFVPVLLVAMGILWRLTGKLSRLQVVTGIMVIFFGGLTVWFNDERFFKIKTTIVYAFLAGLLGLGLLMKRSFLEYVMGDMVPMEQTGWMILTRRLAMAFAALAVANEVIWRTFSDATWVAIETFGFPIALFLFLWMQLIALQKYLIEEPPEEGS